MTRTLVTLLSLITVLLAGCASTPALDPNGAPALRYTMTDDQVIERIRTERTSDRHPELVGNALLVGLWDERPAIVRAALAAGADPNRTITFKTLYGMGADLHLISPPGLGHALRRPSGPSAMHDENVPAFPPRLLVRSSAALDLLLAHGMRHEDQAARDEALYAALIVGKEASLADRLQAMGARIDSSPRPGAMPLQEALARYAQPDLVEWALRHGLDPHLRYSTPEPWRKPARFGDRQYHHYTLDFSMLHTVGQTGLPIYYMAPDREREAQRAVSVARLLVAAGADVNARGTKVVNIGQAPQPRYDWTPLHSAYRGLWGDGQTTNRALVELLLSSGADASAMDSLGNQPVQVANVNLQVEHQARREIQAARQPPAQAKTQRSSSSTSSGNVFGQVMAIAGLATVGGAAARSGVDSGTVARVIGGGVADVLTDGRAGGLSQAQQQIQRQGAQRQPSPAQVATGPAFQSETYTFTCPSGAKGEVPLRFRTSQCRAAMIDYARTYACNEVNRFQQVEQGCQSACGSRTCEQR